MPSLTGCATLDRRSERSLRHVVRVGGYGAVSPQPSHHLGEREAAELLAVQVHAPGVVQVVALLLERFLHPHILKEPVPARVVAPVADSAVVVSPIAQEDPD